MVALWIAGPAHASAVTSVACVPYTIPIASTVEACGPGLVGTKYKTKSKACPSGTVMESQEYDTSNCLPAAPRPGSVNNTNKCLVTPDACAPTINTSNCDPGWHWTLQGSDIAHCVMDDPVCPWGTSLEHDRLGNPRCETNTCSGGQVLQADGKSCACPANMVLDGGTCVPAVPSCNEGIEERSRSCSTGYTGSILQERQTTCPSGPYGAPLVTSWYQTDNSCEPISTPPTTPTVPTAPVTCTAGSTTEWSMCPEGGAAMWRYHTTSCPSGSSGAPSTSTSDWDTSMCPAAAEPAPSAPPAPPATPADTPPATGSESGSSTPPPDNSIPTPCTETSSFTTKACTSGYTGTMTTIITNHCPAGSGSSTEVIDNCGCANGAADYPTCTPPPPPPTQVNCMEEERVVALSNACERAMPRVAVAQQDWMVCTKDGDTVSEKYLSTSRDGVQDCFSGIIVWR